MLRYLTAGESHGKALVAILEGMPAGIKIDPDFINQELKRRQEGYGRGARMQIERDKAQILSGFKKGVSLGSPITLLIANKDSSIETLPGITCPRPGHADLAGALKYGFTDIREVLERASARSVVATVAIGAVCKIFLREFKIGISSQVVSVGGETSAQGIKGKIDGAIKNKDTIGGVFEVIIKGAPYGLGSYVQSDRRLDSRLAQEIIAIPGIKAVEFGLGFGYAEKFGSEVHDAIYYRKEKGYFHKTNNAGGIEGGISNGENIVIRGCMKPISTLLNPLDSVDIVTKRPAKATVQRSDICVVQAAGVVAESSCAYVIAGAMLEKFGADTMADIKKAYQGYIQRISP